MMIDNHDRGPPPPTVFHDVIANQLRLLYKESWIDRRGRVKGNYMALLDLMRGRVNPEHILELA